MKKIKENTILKFVYKTLKLIIGLIFLLVISVILVQRVFNNKVALGGYRIFTVVTGSMEPVYKVTDMLLVKTINPDEVKLNDDIAFLGNYESADGKIITHRVIEIEEDSENRKFQTKGLANPAEDPFLVGEDQLYGKVVAKLSFFSFLSRILNSNYGLFFLIALPMAFLILLEIIDVMKKRDELEKENETSDELPRLKEEDLEGENETSDELPRLKEEDLEGEKEEEQ